MQSTVPDFWQMIWDQNTRVIIMVTSLTEKGVERCADYLPPSEVLDCHRLFGDYQITLKKREVKEKFIISNLQLKNLETNLWRDVTHLWYGGWPVQGVPSDPNAMLAFVMEARSHMKTNSGPHVVHCSPGTGRTGTVIACDMAIRDFELTRTVDVPKTVYAVRRCRAGAVQTRDQYALIYKVYK
uniref:Tyrosine-protein phosphatase non-receptor type 6 n=1 Tax=Schizaphis graminum TaxID=13262 RepID=A0A2S2PBA0_SCHGA